MLKYFYIIIISVFVTGCVPAMVEKKGHVDNSGRLKQLQSGVTTREQVRELLGTPSISNNFGAETWYYISNRKESVAFLTPEIKDQNVIRIIFNNDGLIDKIEQYNTKDMQKIAIADEETPTEGQQMGFFEQILGNIGRFNAGDRGLAGSGMQGGVMGGAGGGNRW
jgi:outer membrane protein assembly factor BamE (lipoprotein component of BamABCDE complex)